MVGMAFSAMAQHRTVYYISPEGNDDNPGTEQQPFASMERAVDAVYQTSGPVVLEFAGGLYEMEDKVTLEKRDNVTFRAQGDALPVFVGSKAVGGWKRVTSRAILNKVSPEARKRLVVTDLSKQGIENLGDPLKTGKRPLLYCDGVEQKLARYPNEGFVYGGKALGQTIIPPFANGNTGAEEPIFEYTDPRIDRWTAEKDPKVGGYFFWDWADSYHAIDSIDVKNRVMTVKGGDMFRHGLRFFGLNLLCEIDEPGEWYIDRTDSKLYWFPPVGVDPVKGNADIRLTTLGSKFMLNFINCSGITVEGLCFRQSRGGAILVEGGENDRILDCLIEDFGSLAVLVKGGFRHFIDGCVMRHLGAAGVQLQGGDRRNLIPAGHEMSNTLIEDWERFKRTYSGAFTASGCGIYLHHCEFCDAPSSAFSLEGNDLIAEFNYIHEVGKESDDQGGFDLYLNPSMRGLVMRYNYWQDIQGGTHYGVAGIRLDDLITGVQIYGNVFERCGSREFGAVQIHGGSENMIEDNLFFDCPMVASVAPYDVKEWHETYDSIHRIMFEEVDIHSAEYLRRYPEIREFGKNINVNIFRNNLAVDCDQFIFHALASHKLKEPTPQIESNNHMVKSEGRTPEQFCTAEVLHPLGIKTIPVQEMGIKTNKLLGK